jgi:predicted DNA-binding transcriptional regulator AlpA
MAQSEAFIVVHVPETPCRGGRKKKHLKVKVMGDIHADALTSLRPISNAINQQRQQRLPDLIKLCKLPELLGMSKSSVYRMTKNGLPTSRPTSPKGDQHVRREDLEEFLAMSGLRMKPRRGRTPPEMT